jgi:hypothetical protein
MWELEARLAETERQLKLLARRLDVQDDRLIRLETAQQNLLNDGAAIGGGAGTPAEVRGNCFFDVEVEVYLQGVGATATTVAVSGPVTGSFAGTASSLSPFTFALTNAAGMPAGTYTFRVTAATQQPYTLTLAFRCDPANPTVQDPAQPPAHSGGDYTIAYDSFAHAFFLQMRSLHV